jgi:hypothetical protein
MSDSRARLVPPAVAALSRVKGWVSCACGALLQALRAARKPCAQSSIFAVRFVAALSDDGRGVTLENVGRRAGA